MTGNYGQNDCIPMIANKYFSRLLMQTGETNHLKWIIECLPVMVTWFGCMIMLYW